MLDHTFSNESSSIATRVCEIHDEIRILFPALCRIAITVYDRETDILKTFAHSTDGTSPISFYEAPMSKAKSLQEIAKDNQPRTIDDLSLFSVANAHTKNLVASGIFSSFTLPIRFNGNLYGFLFFNASQKNYFSKQRLVTLNTYASVLSLLMINELQTLQTLKGALQTAREFSRLRDEETGNHLERMSRYSRIIARDLALENGKEDDWVEYVFQFAPLHDVGKVAVPDHILLKPGRLTPDEYEIMKTHVIKGGDIINIMKNEFGLNNLNHFDMLINIVVYHHEKLDGSGYPHGLKGSEIPLEARIVTVADVFDALTSCRPYKKSWTNEDAFALLKEGSNKHFDPKCVASLIRHEDEIKAIQNTFREDDFA